MDDSFKDDDADFFLLKWIHLDLNLNLTHIGISAALTEKYLEFTQIATINLACDCRESVQHKRHEVQTQQEEWTISILDNKQINEMLAPTVNTYAKMWLCPNKT